MGQRRKRQQINDRLGWAVSHLLTFAEEELEDFRQRQIQASHPLSLFSGGGGATERGEEASGGGEKEGEGIKKSGKMGESEWMLRSDAHSHGLSSPFALIVFSIPIHVLNLELAFSASSSLAIMTRG
jgi:hypothetical protein